MDIVRREVVTKPRQLLMSMYSWAHRYGVPDQLAQAFGRAVGYTMGPWLPLSLPENRDRNTIRYVAANPFMEIGRVPSPAVHVPAASWSPCDLASAATPVSAGMATGMAGEAEGSDVPLAISSRDERAQYERDVSELIKLACVGHHRMMLDELWKIAGITVAAYGAIARELGLDWQVMKTWYGDLEVVTLDMVREFLTPSARVADGRVSVMNLATIRLVQEMTNIVWPSYCLPPFLEFWSRQLPVDVHSRLIKSATTRFGGVKQLWGWTNHVLKLPDTFTLTRHEATGNVATTLAPTSMVLKADQFCLSDLMRENLYMRVLSAGITGTKMEFLKETSLVVTLLIRAARISYCEAANQSGDHLEYTPDGDMVVDPNVPWFHEFDWLLNGRTIVEKFTLERIMLNDGRQKLERHFLDLPPPFLRWVWDNTTMSVDPDECQLQIISPYRGALYFPELDLSRVPIEVKVHLANWLSSTKEGGVVMERVPWYEYSPVGAAHK